MGREKQIRKLLGNRFHLSTEYGGENCELTNWKLFRRYENSDPIYWSEDNKAIMRAEENTLEDLYNFAKAHRKYDLERIMTRMNLCAFIILLIMSVANVFIQSKIISTIILTSDIILLSWLGVACFVSNRNFKVDCLEMNENWKRHTEDLFASLENKEE